MKKQIKKIYVKRYYSLSDLCNYNNAVACSKVANKSNIFNYYFEAEEIETKQDLLKHMKDNINNMYYYIVETARKLYIYYSEQQDIKEIEKNFK